MTANLDLSIEALRLACKGNVEALPDLMVHDNDAWPHYETVRVDSKNRIHMRRSTFQQAVVGQIPVEPVMWVRKDCHLYRIALRPDHLQGSDDRRAAPENHKHSRKLVKADDQGRIPGDEGYGEAEPIAGRYNPSKPRG